MGKKWGGGVGVKIGIMCTKDVHTRRESRKGERSGEVYT